MDLFPKPPSINQFINSLDTWPALVREEFKQRGINVKWFGAKGDGVTDDTAAIQATINAVPDFGIVYIPPGNYSFTGTLLFTRPIHVICEGLLLYGGSNIAIDIRCCNSKFDNLFVKSTQPEPTNPSLLTGIGIRLYGAKNVVLLNPSVEIMNKGIYLLGPTSGAGYIWVYNPIVQYCLSAIEIDVESGGWANETAWFGGRIGVSPVWTIFTGTRFININNSGNNGHKFFGIALESTQVERKIYCAGHDNEFTGCRFEGSNDTCDIEFTPTSSQNGIIGGYYIEGQKITDSGTFNEISGKFKKQFKGMRTLGLKLMTASGYLGNEPVILADASAGNISITLQHPRYYPYQIYTIKKIDASANTVLIARGSSDFTIEGTSSYILSEQYQTVTLYNDNNNWYILSKI